jgi:hypothetical protein
MKIKKLALLLVVVVLLLLAGHALAMSSANYKIDWMVPLTGGGGGEANSANYKVNLTVGQTVIGSASSANYGACLGYWCGTSVQYQLFLPLTLK